MNVIVMVLLSLSYEIDDTMDEYVSCDHLAIALPRVRHNTVQDRA